MIIGVDFLSDPRTAGADAVPATLDRRSLFSFPAKLHQQERLLESLHFRQTPTARFSRPTGSWNCSRPTAAPSSSGADGARIGVAVYDALKAQPILSLSSARARTGLAFRTAASAMELLVEQGIARELTGKRRGRLFVHDRYLALLNEGTEP